MPKKRTRVVFDHWDSYVSNSEDKPLFISFDVEAAKEDMTDTLAHCARVIIPIRKPNENGGPVPPETDRLYELEDELCAALVQERVACRLVGRLTHNGMRELVFQLEDWESFRPPVGVWMMSHKKYKIDVSEHEGWTFFDDSIRPTPAIWLMLADQSVVRLLLEDGSDPSKEHALEFVFTGEESGLRKAARSLKKRGYVEQVPPDAESQIVMVKKMVLDEDAIIAESQAHTELAEKCGIDYDGWGAAVVP